MTRLHKSSLAMAVVAALTGCGGGGGGGSSATLSPFIRSEVPFYTPTAINHYSPTVTSSYTVPVTDIFTKDLNGDRVDEVVVAATNFNGSATSATWKNSNLQIYGFNNGSFKNETSTWFAGNDNRYLGGTTIKFGDFNGDGKIDMFAANFTDNPNITGAMPVFFNTGRNSFTRSNIDFGNVDAHDSIVTDLNGDGYADIIVSDLANSKPAVAFGSSTGAFTMYRSDTFGGGAGISVADYLGNGTKTIVLTDAPYSTGGGDDTRLFSWNIVGGKLVLTKVADLPPDRFTLPKWATVLAQSGIAPHAVRNITMDFDNDGRPDVVVFSTLPKNGNTHGYSEVQFLKNNGGGSFTDVTDTVLAKYDNNKTTTYNPVLIDVNNDGLVDILISATDYTGQASTSVLLATQEGKFVESYTQVFTDFANQTKSITADAIQNQAITIVAGPNDKKYLMTGVETTDANGAAQIAVYLSLIGSTGTVTAPATVAVLQQAWPWMSASQANETLARTASSFIDGIPVIDWQSVMTPIGGLGITLDGRTGPRTMLMGSISVPGLDKRLLSNLQAVDAIGRNFGVDISGMAAMPRLMPINYSLADTTDVTRNWSSRLVTEDRREWAGVSLSGRDGTHFSTSMTNRHFGDPGPITYRLGMTKMPGSPWVNFTGVFGSPESSTIIDFTATRTWQDGWFAQGGVMQTSTELRRGLVRDVTPLWAGYAVTGYQDQTWTAYAGLQPTIFAGHLDMRLPTAVDKDGTMQYTDATVKIRNQPVGFAGIERRWTLKDWYWKLSGVVNDRGQYQTQLTYGVKF